MALEDLLTEQPYPASSAIDQVPVIDILRIMNAADAEIAAAVRNCLEDIEKVVVASVAAIESGGRVRYIGAGTSGRLGVLDASECPPTFGVDPDLVRGIIAGGESALARATEASEDDPEAGVRDLLAVGFDARDLLIGIAASGRTPYVLGAVAKARSLGAQTAGISCSPNAELSRAVDFPVEIPVGPEVIAGSTRLRAGTATKLALNMISTATMIRLGYVYRNLMVNVQPKNEKLVDRARRIIRQATGVDAQRAAELFEASGRRVKTAIVMEKLGLGRTEADTRLDKVRGHVSEALKGG